jgi:hypothetical protein
LSWILTAIERIGANKDTFGHPRNPYDLLMSDLEASANPTAMTSRSTSVRWQVRPTSGRKASARRGLLARLVPFALFVSVFVTLVCAGLIDGKSSIASTGRPTLSILSSAFAARSTAGAYSFSERKWQSCPSSPEVGLDAVEADLDDVDACGRDVGRNLTSVAVSASATRESASGCVDRAEEARVPSRFAAESGLARGPPA